MLDRWGAPQARHPNSIVINELIVNKNVTSKQLRAISNIVVIIIINIRVMMMVIVISDSWRPPQARRARFAEPFPATAAMASPMAYDMYNIYIYIYR